MNKGGLVITASKREGPRTRVNEQITVSEVRLIDADGNQVGIVPLQDALRLSVEQELDLVEISPTAQPPVCRIMNYGKFVFESKKQGLANKKKQNKTQVKELKFRPVTEEGDYQVKFRNLIRFLTHGDKVKITLRFRGREVAHQELGMRMMERLQQDIAEEGIVEQQAKREGRQIVMVIAPKKK